MTRKLLTVLLLAFAMTAVAFADASPIEGEKALSVVTYQFKHKDADKATALIKSLMSGEGSLSMQAGSNALVITDRAENLKAITAALAQYDAPPQPVRLAVRLASARMEGKGSVPESLKDVAPNLAMLRFNSFDALGNANVEGKEGDSGLIDLGTTYRADFRFGEYDPTTDSIPLADFRLSKLDGDQLQHLYKTTLNLKIGRTVIFAATRDPQSNRALIVILTARK